MRTILITGATSGIGYELARYYAERGARLILIGRKDPAELDPEFFTPQRYCQADLSQPDAAERVLAFVNRQRIGALDVLVHNAGIGYYGSVTDQPAESVEQLVAVNLRAPVALTHGLYPCLQSADRPKLVFISSVAAALPTPDYTVYAATKAALDGLAKNLRIEFDDIDVQLIHPGATRTDMHRKSGVPAGELDTSKYPSAAEVAVQIADVIESNRSQAAIGWTNKLLRWAGTHAARLVDVGMRRAGT